ncbi:MAG: cyclic nucleotide-binding domain-containing protein [Desulfobacteraceae bacterium]|nr:cyclic nucleotide-binding domain-containing protein [Desulfobacteraceae bacterium]
MLFDTINKKLIGIVFILVFCAFVPGWMAIWYTHKQEAMCHDISGSMAEIKDQIKLQQAKPGADDDAFEQISENIASLQQRINETERSARKDKIIVVAVMSLFVIIAALIVVQINHTISRPIKRTIEVLAEASDKVTSASVQVSSVSQGTAEETSSQVTSLQEAIASLEKMSSLTKTNEKSATCADNLMQEGKQAVDMAYGFMADLITSMEEIFSASEQMHKIIKNIDEVAFQTKILAINAAIEAARVGEAGAGFAVVAEEVNKLALKTVGSAQETSDLLENTIIKIEHGTELARKTNSAFKNAVLSVGSVSKIVKEIDRASRKQSQGIEQTYNSVATMHKATHQSAINAEMSASASVEMFSQAEQLTWFVDELRMLVGGYKGLDKLVHSLIRKDLSPGQILIRQGEKGEEAYIIEKGVFNVYIDENPDNIITSVKAGDIVGEVALVMDVMRTANVVAATQARAIVLPKDEFLKAFKGQTELNQSILNMIKRRMAGIGD